MRYSLLFAAAALACAPKFRFADDDGGGSGGGSEAPAAPEQKPAKACPFSGSTNLDTTGSVVICNDNGVQGPVPKEGQSNIDAWNERAGESDDDTDEAPEEMPDADPAATAASFKGIGGAKAAYVAMAEKANTLAGKLGAARKNAKSAEAASVSLRQAHVAAVRDKVAAEQKLKTVIAERDQLAADKAGEPQRFNAEVARTLASHTHPQITGNASSQPGATAAVGNMKRSDFNAMKPRERMEFVRKGGKLTE